MSDVKKIICLACGRGNPGVIESISVGDSSADFFVHKRCQDRDGYRERVFASLAQGEERARQSMLDNWHSRAPSSRRRPAIDLPATSPRHPDPVTGRNGRHAARKRPFTAFPGAWGQNPTAPSEPPFSGGLAGPPGPTLRQRLESLYLDLNPAWLRKVARDVERRLILVRWPVRIPAIAPTDRVALRAGAVWTVRLRNHAAAD